jgi:hypothetical protein
MGTNTAILEYLAFGEGVMQPVKVNEIDAFTTYVGYCLSKCKGIDDPTWLIKKIKQVGSVKTISFPNGKKKYNQKWSEHTALTYKITEFAPAEE